MSIQEHIAGTLQRQLRIAVVTETFPPEINGVAHSVGRICSKLTERGVSIQVVRPRQRDEDNPWIDDQILVRGISLPNYSQVQLGLPAGRLLLQNWRAIRPDIVHIVTGGILLASPYYNAPGITLRVFGVIYAIITILGFISLKAMRGFQVDTIFLAIMLIGLLGLISDILFRLLRRWLCPWAA